MKPVFVLLLYCFVLLVSFDHEIQLYNFKAVDVEEIYIHEPIYFNEIEVGEIASFNLDSSKNTGFGKLKFLNKFRPTKQMQFYNETSLLGNPRIVIKKDKNFRKEGSISRADTILLIATKLNNN